MTDKDIIVSTSSISSKIHKLVANFEAWIEQSPRQTVEIVKRVHKLVDQFVKLAGVAEDSPCTVGCAACCKHSVSVTISEAHAIEQIYNLEPVFIDMENGQFFRDDGQKYEGLLCPFNQEGQCQIYEWRPIVCRSYFSQEESAVYCSFPDDKIVRFGYNSSPLIMHLYRQLATSGNVKGIADIRDYFGSEPIKL